MSLNDNENVIFVNFCSDLNCSCTTIVTLAYLLCCYVHIFDQPSFTALTNQAYFDKIKIILTSCSQKPLHQLGSNDVEMIFDPTFSDSSILPCLRHQHQQWPCNNSEHHIWSIFDFSNNIFIVCISALYVGVTIQMWSWR
jgi:hypothetical protein